ncbi:transglutaminase family protein [Cyanobacteria bacterium FACHB-471]|nr:transglutaminase family protein [Cyanobacteria bacterium FACHB-471]
MYYKITHATTYSYKHPVTLSPHVLRLRPRSDVAQTLHRFSLETDPQPIRVVENIDLDGNAELRLWFAEEAIATLTITTTSEVETFRTNPFDYLVESWAIQLPVNYPASLLTQLQPYLGGQFLYFSSSVDPVAVQLAEEIWQDTNNTISFLTTLNQRIHESCKYIVRETGEPFPAGITWTQKSGSCRDLAVLFVETCRAIGLAARFVSGYQSDEPKEAEGEGGDRQTDTQPTPSQEHNLHAWAEVYLPGAGWRGYDPTQGLAVADHHIALVASPFARQTVPIVGSLKHGVGTKSDMQYHLSIAATLVKP